MTAYSPSTHPSRRAQKLLHRFARHPSVGDDAAATLEQVLSASPLLTSQLNQAVRHGDLRAFDLLEPGSHAGGVFDGDTGVISIPLGLLTRQGEPEIAFILGHELQHAVGSAEAQRRVARFFESAEWAAAHDFDYTPAIRDHLDWHRQDEAAAHLAGWNGLVDWIGHYLPDPTLVDVVLATRFRAGDFVEPGDDSFVIKPLLSVRPDLRFDLTDSNIAAMSTYYFDRSPSEMQLGALGTSDYRNEYGCWAVMQAAACHRHFTRVHRPQPTMIINTTELGLTRRIMEENGIDLGGLPTQPYLDRSADPPRLGLLHHTVGTHQFVPDDHLERVGILRSDRPVTGVIRSSSVRTPGALRRTDRPTASRPATPRRSQGRSR